MADTRSIAQKLSDGWAKFMREKVIPAPQEDPNHYMNRGKNIGSDIGFSLPIVLLWVTLLNKSLEAFMCRNPMLFPAIWLTGLFAGPSIGKNIGAFIDCSFNPHENEEKREHKMK